MPAKHAAVMILASLGMLIAPSPTAAQDRPSIELAGGYQFMGDTGLGESPFPIGWFVSPARQASDHVAVVGEIAGSHNLTLYTYMGGFRLAFRPRVRVFVHLLGGVAYLARSNDSGLAFFAVQPGGGIDVPLTERLTTRIMVDYRRLFDPDAEHQVRIAAGIVIGFGGP